MSEGRRSSSVSYAPTWKVYAANAIADCIADSPDFGDGVAKNAGSCASKVVLLAAGNFTSLKDIKGVDKPITAAPAGYEHKSDVSLVQCSVAFVVYWGKSF